MTCSERERWGSHYVPTVAGRRYDAFIWLDQTKALRPLHGEPWSDLAVSTTGCGATSSSSP